MIKNKTIALIEVKIYNNNNNNNNNEIKIFNINLYFFKKL